MEWDDLDRLEERAYQVRRGHMRGDYSTDETHGLETRLQRAEMGDDLDDY